MLQLQQRVLDVNMNPNQPCFLGNNHRLKVLQQQEIQPRSSSLQIQNNRVQNFTSFESDLRNSLLVQSHLEYQEKLKHLMITQNQILKQQLIEIENKQLKFQNEMLQQHVQKMQSELENTVKQINKAKLPSLSSQVETQRTFAPSENQQKYKKQRSLFADETQMDKDDINENSSRSITEFQHQTSKTAEQGQSKFPLPFRIEGDYEYQVIKKKEREPLQSQQQRKNRKYKKIRKYFIAVLAFVRLAKSLKKNRQRRLKSLKDKFEIVKSNLLKQPEDQVQKMLYEFVYDVFDELLLELNKQSFIKHCDKPDYDANAESNILFRQELIIKLSQQFFTNLEIKTREGKVSPLIIQILFLSMFQSQNPQASLFVAKRTNFYMKNSIKIPMQQEKLLISEYFFFRLIIYNMLKIFNSTKYKNQTHEKLCKFFATVIASFIQILYIDYFEDLKFVSKINVRLYQRKIVLDQQLKASMIEDDDIDQKETLVLGLHERNQFEALFQSQINWITSIGQIFNKIVSNLHNLIQS